MRWPRRSCDGLARVYLLGLFHPGEKSMDAWVQNVVKGGRRELPNWTILCGIEEGLKEGLLFLGWFACDSDAIRERERDRESQAW